MIERILFAQPLALGVQVFAPIREYLASERDRRGLTNQEIDAALGCNGMAGHWFGASQWSLPSRERYQQLRDLFNAPPNVDDYLRTEYDNLRRPFDLGPESGARPRGEVWRYAPPPPGRPGDLRHPCEKPSPLLDHMVLTSTKPDALILDSFAGSHSTAEAAVRNGRRFIGSEAHEPYCEMGVRRIVAAASHEQPDLFGEPA